MESIPGRTWWQSRGHPQASHDEVDNLKEINFENLGYELSYTGPFSLAALSEEEFMAIYFRFKGFLASPHSPALPVDDGTELDDATCGAVNPIKNQVHVVNFPVFTR